MIRSAASKVMWVGRATVFLVGLAVILALLFGVASTALGKNGQALILGKGDNVATKVTGLIGKVATGSALVVKNPSGGSALELRVGDPAAAPSTKTTAPMKVDSEAKVANLNADQMDGLDSAAFQRANAVAGGDLTGTYPNPQIAPNAVSGGLNGEITNDTVDQNDIASGGVGSDEVANNSLSIFTDGQGETAGQSAFFNGFTIPAQGCRLSVATLSDELTHVGDLIVTEVTSGTLPDGIYIPAIAVTKEGEIERIICNATASDISLSGSFQFRFQRVR